MIDDVRTIDVGGNRVVRLGRYQHQHDDETERRIFIAAGWAGSPPLPAHEQTVDLPATALPALVAVLEDLGGES